MFPIHKVLNEEAYLGLESLWVNIASKEPKNQEVETKIEFLPSLVVYQYNLHRYYSIFAESIQSEFSLTAVHILRFFLLKALTDHK